MSRFHVGERVSYAYPPKNPYWIGQGIVLRVERTYAIVQPDGQKHGYVFKYDELHKLKKQNKN